jgi:hypothetical protein
VAIERPTAMLSTAGDRSVAASGVKVAITQFQPMQVRAAPESPSPQLERLINHYACVNKSLPIGRWGCMST